ncbi:uncharacterized protein FOMMEDRAFT_159424 [Fomitiporia mediterranea MF3/22]|uniref:uncharacterized protein n=1 Tax=Fomitiporia mediterranea (strain MF3/22) TaxID=694068 RepID=UPI00044074FE|nr:uncharacterized protein FOMMEDRAFT_159424 [Fomitiporia mediterranea MF3/22]EJD00656.1 hypothetical protein FOMMEDRAFT_159424 [Fomitiporia mediterranea MF3/22]
MFRIPPQGGGRRAKGRHSSSSSGHDNGERSKHRQHKHTHDRGGRGDRDRHHRHKRRSPRRESVAEVHTTERRKHRTRNGDKPVGVKDEEQSDTGTSLSRRASRADVPTKTKAKQADGEQPDLKKRPRTSRRPTGLFSTPTQSKAEPARQKVGNGARQAEKKTTPKRRTTTLSSAPTANGEPGVDSDSSSNLKTAGKAKVQNATKREASKRPPASRSTATTKKKPALLEAPKKITVVCDPKNKEYVEYVQELRDLFSELGLPTHLCTEDGFIQINRSLQQFHSDRYLAGKPKDEQPSAIEQEARRDTFGKFRNIRDRIKAHRNNETETLDKHNVRVRDGVLDIFEKGSEKAKLARENYENELREHEEREEVITKRMEEYDEGIKENAQACISVALRGAVERRVEELKLKEERAKAANAQKYPIRTSQTWPTAGAPEFNLPRQSYSFPMNGYEGASAGSAAYGNYGSTYGSEYAESTDYTEDSVDEDEDDEDDEETTTYKYIPQQIENGAGTSGSMGGRAPGPGMSDWETMKILERESPATADYYKRQVMAQRGISHF